jgi:hypothetical protein
MAAPGGSLRSAPFSIVMIVMIWNVRGLPDLYTGG